MLQVIRENNHLAFALTFEDARQAIEDDAVIAWENLRDPNAADAQVYPGLEWSINGPDDCFAWLHFGEALIEYSIVDPTPFAAWAACNMAHDEDRPVADCILVTYDNKGCDYAHSQELIIWLY